MKGPATTLVVILLAAFAAAASAQVESTDFKIASVDGFELHGTHFDPGRAGLAVLMLHQCNRSDQEGAGFESIGPMLAERGIHAVMFDSRGFGKSRSEDYPAYRSHMDAINRLGWRDTEVMVDHVRSLEGVQSGHIGVLGASCGTWKIIPVAAERAEIRTMVFLSGSYLTVPTVSEAFDRIADRPILTIFSEDDGYGTPDSMRDAFARTTNPHSRMLVFKGDLHGTDLFERHAELELDVTRWFESRLGHR